MAKRSDFAQKLLDDLRLRKERLVAAQDSHAYTKQTFKGSTNNGKVAMRIENSHVRSSRANRSLGMQESSAQIVPFKRSQGSSQQIGDLSMALTLALENVGGKLTTRIDSSGRSSVLTFHRTGPRGNQSRVPSLSNLHIQEISKGAQKLNQILRACSNGLSFDQYSVEIGKELLKGAVDLQQSLQMLVNLQEASEFMVRPHRKNRIVLLEDGKEVQEEEGESVKDKQLDLLPRFSFDKPTRPGQYPNKHQRLPALLYPSESTLSTIPTHKRSTSHGTEKNSSDSPIGKVEKGRMSSVIAKLMGLEEVPGDKDSGSKSKGNVGPISNKHGISFVIRPEKNFALRFEERSPWKSVERDKVVISDRGVDRNRVLRRKNGGGLGEKETRLALQEKAEDKERKVRTEKRNPKKSTGNDAQQGHIPRATGITKESGLGSGSERRHKKLNEPISRATSEIERLNKDKLKTQKYASDEAVQRKPSKEFLRGGKIIEPIKTGTRKINLVKKAQGSGFPDVVTPMPKKSAPREAKQLNNGKVNGFRQAKTERTEEVISNAPKHLKSENEMAGPGNNRLYFEGPGGVKNSTLSPEDSGRSILLSPVTSDRHSPVTLDLDKEAGSAKEIPNPSNGTVTNTENQLLSEKFDNEKNIPVPETQEPLTESETRLKHILVKSRVFLNTAEALFKLDIPIGILDARSSDYTSEEFDDKVSLDCSFEIAKRKGRLLEIELCPFARKAQTGYRENTSFDGLVKQLCKSFEELRSYGRIGRLECEVEDYLPRMLELDVYARNPESDCMWDLGWDVVRFAIVEKVEVVKDLERLIVISLIDEVMRDFLRT